VRLILHRVPRPLGVLLAALLVLTAPARASDDSLRDEWMRILLNGSPAGYVHTVVRGLPDGSFSTWIETQFKMARMGSPITITTAQTLVEDKDGIVQQLSWRTQMPGESRASAVVDGDALHIIIEEPTGTRTVEMSWDPAVRGLEYWRRALVEWLPGRAVGDIFEQKTFELELGEVAVSTYEITGFPGELVEVRTDVDLMPGMSQTVLMKSNGDVVSLEMTMMGISFLMEVTSKEKALEAISAGGVAPEVFATTVLRPDHPLPRPRSLDRVLFRLTAKDVAIPFPDFSSERQRVLESGPGEVLLEIRRIEPYPGGEATAPGPEFLAPNATLQSDDAQVIALSEQLAEGAESPWEVARQLERGVYRHIDKKSFGVAFATASEVCRDRSGDCSEHAVLLAAVARVQGIPSRVAMGLTYVGGIFGGHAWTEVWIDGRWIALDATLGLGSVDAAHIRFSASSLDGLGMGAGMLSSLMGLANLEIQVLETESGGDVRRFGDQESAPFTVEGRALTSHIYGVSVEAPEGFSWDAENPHWMSGRLARAAGPDGQHLDLYAIAVGYDFSESDLGGEAKAGQISVRRTVHGRPALVGERRSWTLRVLDGDTVFRLDLDVEDEDEALETLLELAGAISFDD
jgi:hypothetical protein